MSNLEPSVSVEQKQRGQELRGDECRCILRAYAGGRAESDWARRTTPISLNAVSGLALRMLEHLVLLQQGIHGFPKQILLGPTVLFCELVQK